MKKASAALDANCERSADAIVLNTKWAEHS